MADKRFTLRLSPTDEALLEELAAYYGLDRSATVRRALRVAARPKPINGTGVFLALPPGSPQFSIQFAREEHA